MYHYLMCILFAGLVSAQQLGNQPAKKIPEMDHRCLECICQASSNCDESLKCHTAGSNYFCGPYVVSWAYWHDGGRPGDKGRAHDFETCLNNKTCAEQAVRGYMRKYGQDCDTDKDIDCWDFARIHKLGFGACGGDAIVDTDYFQKFAICYDPQEDIGLGSYEYGDEQIQARGAAGYRRLQPGQY